MRTTFPEYVVALATIVGSVLFSVSSLMEIGGKHYISFIYEIVNHLNTCTLPFLISPISLSSNWHSRRIIILNLLTNVSCLIYAYCSSSHINIISELYPQSELLGVYQFIAF